MAFPQSTLPVSAWIAPGADPAGDPGEWTWTEITNDARVASGITIEGGRSDEANRVDPGKCSVALDNRSGNYSPRNPLGTWYGQLAKNTPLQVRLTRASDTFNRTAVTGGWGVSTSGHTWSHTGASNWTTTGTKGRMTLATANALDFALLNGADARDVDMVYAATMPSVTTGAQWISGAMVRYADTSNTYWVYTEFKPAGVITVKIVRNKAGVFSALGENLTPGVTYTAGAKIWTRVQADGPTIRARIWADGSPEPTDWDVSVDDGAQLNGTGVGFLQWRVVGNTNAGSLYIDIDDVTITGLLFTGTVAEWPVRWDQSGNDCVTTIQASGILRRLQQGTRPLRSPLYRQLTRYTPAGYWPLEDGSDATAASSAATGGLPAAVTDVTFAANDTLPGAETTLTLNSVDSSIRGRVTKSTGTGFAAMFLMRLAALPAGKTTFIEWSGTGTVKTWRISGDSTSVYVEGLDEDGAVITGGSGPVYVVDPTQWVGWQLEATPSGGNINWALLWHQVGTQVFWAHTGTKAGSVGRITAFNIPGSTGLTDAAFGHVYAGADTLPFVDDRFSLVSNGYAGELGADRVQRLCDEESVRVVVEPGDSQPQGPQRVGTFLELLQAVEDADLGVLYERGTALAYRPYGARFDTTSVADLDFDQGHIADPPEPTDDDQRVRNDVTVKRDAGGETTATDSAHVALNGRYDEAVTVNVQTDDQLPDLANWRLHLGTWDEMRWPRVTLNLARNPQLIPDWMSVQVGSRITIANPPAQVAGGTVSVVVEGFSQTLTPYTWDVELNCSPASPWAPTLVDNTDARIDTDGSELATGVNAAATALSVTVTSGPLWTTDPAEFPFDVNVSGIRITVTNVTGASSPQTFTVTRSVDGFDKALPAGADVRLWTPSFISL